MKTKESILCNRTTTCWRPQSARDRKPQNKEQYTLDFTKVLLHVHRTAHSSPNAHIFYIALTYWASLQLASSFMNLVLCERSFAKLWWLHTPTVRNVVLTIYQHGLGGRYGGGWRRRYVGFNKGFSVEIDNASIVLNRSWQTFFVVWLKSALWTTKDSEFCSVK